MIWNSKNYGNYYQLGSPGPLMNIYFLVFSAFICKVDQCDNSSDLNYYTFALRNSFLHSFAIAPTRADWR